MSTATAERPEAPPAEGAAEPGGQGLRLAGLCGLVAVALGFFTGIHPLGDNSFFTHLATGRLMLEDGIVRSDPYTFTSPGEGWVVQSWLASLLYGLVDEVAGAGGLRLLTALCSALLAGLTWKLTAPARSLVARGIVTAAVLAVGTVMWSERPLLLGLVALAATLVVLEEGRDVRSIGLIAALWANVHGSFPLGPVVLACLAAGRRLDRQDPSRELSALKWSVAGSVAGGVLNPYGPKLLLFPAGMLTRSDRLSAVVEWASPEFDELFSRAFLLMVVLAVIGLVRTPSYRTALPLVVLTAASLVAVRNVAVAAVVLAGPAALALRDVGEVTGEQRAPRYTAAAVALVAVLGLAGIGRLAGDHYDLDGYPVEAVDRMEERGWRDASIRWAHRDYVGNYLDLRYGAEANVFVDDRYELHGAQLFDDQLTLVRAERGWAGVLDRWQIDLVLWEEDHPLAQLLELDPGWSEAFTADGWSVFCRSSGCP